MAFTTYLKELKSQDEWYTPKEAVIPLLKHVPKNYTIWCPFDKESSEFVQVFRGVDIKLFVLTLMTEKTFSFTNRTNTMTALYQIRLTVKKTQYMNGFFILENRLLCWSA